MVYRRIGKLAAFIGVAHPKLCKEYVSATDKPRWKENCAERTKFEAKKRCPTGTLLALDCLLNTWSVPDTCKYFARAKRRGASARRLAMYM